MHFGEDTTFLPLFVGVNTASLALRSQFMRRAFADSVLTWLIDSSCGFGNRYVIGAIPRHIFSIY